MDPLATTADLEARLGRELTEAEATRAEALLTDASAAVRAIARQTITSTEHTSRVKVRRRRARLPQRPVTAVSTVEDVNGNTVLHTWHGGDVVEVSNNLDSFSFEPWGNGIGWVDVTYTAGWDPVPDVVVGVVCQMVLRAIGQDPMTSGLQQESIGGYSYSVGAAAAAGGIGMLPAERQMIEALFRQEHGVIYAGPV